MTPPHSLERTVVICASRATVFRFFTDPARFAAWWGAGSHIDARPGGEVSIRYPNGVTASGKVVEVVDGERIEFTYGYEAADKPIPPGGSRVVITLADHPQGTLLQLRHELPDKAIRDAHVPGWRYQLALFANAVAREQHGGAGASIDRFHQLWSEPNAARRRSELAELTTEEVVFRDRFGAVSGQADLDEHIGAFQVAMPGTRFAREGAAEQCQGVALTAWTATGPDGAPRGKGTHVFDLAPDGRITRVVGFWAD